MQATHLYLLVRFAVDMDAQPATLFVQPGFRACAWVTDIHHATALHVDAVDHPMRPGEQGSAMVILLCEESLGVTVEPGMYFLWGWPGRRVGDMWVELVEREYRTIPDRQ
jgi:hypothetical protein